MTKVSSKPYEQGSIHPIKRILVSEYGILISVISLMVLIVFTWFGCEMYNLYSDIVKSLPSL